MCVMDKRYKHGVYLAFVRIASTKGGKACIVARYSGGKRVLVLKVLVLEERDALLFCEDARFKYVPTGDEAKELLRRVGHSSKY